MNQAATIYILDANILVRLADTTDAMHATTEQATRSLRGSGATLRTLPQSRFEFWVVATRPREKNGLGLNVDARYIASMQAHGITRLLTFDADSNRYSAAGITIVNPASITAPS